MPDSKTLKKKANAALEENYWKSVFICIVLLVLSMGTVYASLQDSIRSLPTVLTDISNNLASANNTLNMQAVAVLITLVGGVLIVSIIGKLLIGILIENPVKVGGNAFMVKTVLEAGGGEVADLAFSFDHGYLNAVKTMFRKAFFTFLWSLLLLVPGLIKMYEYRLVPYLIKDMPNAAPKEILECSRRYMQGHKKEALMLDLSFIPWYLLAILTLGILQVVYVQPLKALADAAFYLEVKDLNESEAA